MATTSLNNFGVGRCFLDSAVHVLLHLSLAGRGGEVREWKAETTRRSRGGRGVFALACVRGSGWRSSCLPCLLLLFLACHGGEGRRRSTKGRAANPLILKRKCTSAPRPRGSPHAALAHLAGRGGEEVDKGKSVVAGVGGGLFVNFHPPLE
jgi:hypothetical protein